MPLPGRRGGSAAVHRRRQHWARELRNVEERSLCGYEKSLIIACGSQIWAWSDSRSTTTPSSSNSKMGNVQWQAKLLPLPRKIVIFLSFCGCKDSPQQQPSILVLYVLYFYRVRKRQDARDGCCCKFSLLLPSMYSSFRLQQCSFAVPFMLVVLSQSHTFLSIRTYSLTKKRKVQCSMHGCIHWICGEACYYSGMV